VTKSPLGLRRKADTSITRAPDEQVTTQIDVTAYLEQKLVTMRAHATQIPG
jgi:LmbE family N-acetylglucosaminyl deacetylase